MGNILLIFVLGESHHKKWNDSTYTNDRNHLCRLGQHTTIHSQAIEKPILPPLSDTHVRMGVEYYRHCQQGLSHLSTPL